MKIRRTPSTWIFSTVARIASHQPNNFISGKATIWPFTWNIYENRNTYKELASKVKEEPTAVSHSPSQTDNVVVCVPSSGVYGGDGVSRRKKRNDRVSVKSCYNCWRTNGSTYVCVRSLPSSSSLAWLHDCVSFWICASVNNDCGTMRMSWSSNSKMRRRKSYCNVSSSCDSDPCFLNVLYFRFLFFVRSPWLSSKKNFSCPGCAFQKLHSCFRSTSPPWQVHFRRLSE